LVPREERIEAILAAWYELEESAPSEKAKWRERRNALIDQAIAGTRSCHQELLEALGPRFHAYKLARRKEHQAKMAQILRQP
jgi:cytochrome c551/c552